ncbi:MAG: SulP family inorganic anion transporter [Proteobacteria bacterium]|nr:SulP family inorganic anion transporter [Pseudomonadota bacterium]
MNSMNGLGQNLKSGLIVALIATPLCLGIALASNAPLIAGLIAGIIGGLVVGLISDSPLSVSGPAAGLSAIIYQGIIDVGSFEHFTYAIILAGVIQVALSLLKAAKLTDFLPSSVIEGMMAAIGLMLIMKQLPYLFGSQNYTDLKEVFNLSNKAHWGAFFIGAFSFIVFALYRSKILLKDAFFKYLPFPLFLVLTSSTIAFLIESTPMHLFYDDYVHISELVASYTPFQQFSLSNLSLFLDPMILKYGFILAAVASIETLLCIEATDNLDNHLSKTNRDRELLAQGVGNSISGLLGGLAITSVIVRTSANYESGARSKYSAVLHGVFLLAAIVLIPNLIDKIPLAVLATILIFTGFNLAHPRKFKSMWRHGQEEFAPFVITIIAILSLDLLKGVGLGLMSTVIFILKDHYYIQNQKLKIHTEHHQQEKRLVITFGSHLTFLQKKSIEKKLTDLAPEDYQRIMIDLNSTRKVDHEIKIIIKQFIQKLEESKAEYSVTNLVVIGDVHERD